MRRNSGPALLRRLTREKTREVLLKLSRIDYKDVMRATTNRSTQRIAANNMRRRGRGYTTPASGGRSRTRGTGRKN